MKRALFAWMLFTLVFVNFQSFNVKADDPPLNASSSYDCEECVRHAIVDKCTVDDPLKLIVEGEGTEPFETAARTYLWQLFPFDCLYFLNNTGVVESYIQSEYEMLPDWYKEKVAAGELPPLENFIQYLDAEYAFDNDFVSGLEEYTEEGSQIHSHWTASMYFLGEERELVHEWKTNGIRDELGGAGTRWTGHRNKMKSAYKNGPRMDEIIARFEKRPVSCQVKPEKKTVGQMERIDITLSDFIDVFGEPSREFNRIMVHAYHGKILNGEPCNTGPDYKVFKLDQLPITVKYQGPEKCDAKEDRITIFRTCQILPEDRNPIEETILDRDIEELYLTIDCPDAILTLNKSITTRDYSKKEEMTGSCDEKKVKRHELNERISAKVLVSLKQKEVGDMPFTGQRMVYYVPVNIQIASFNVNSKEVRYSSSNITRQGCEPGGYETTVTTNIHAQQPKIEEKEFFMQQPWIVVYDKKTGKAVKIIPAGYSIAFDKMIKEEMETFKWSKDGKEDDSKEDERTKRGQFALGPVGEKIPDPTVQSNEQNLKNYLKEYGVELPEGVDIPQPETKELRGEIQQDLLVTSGDGISELGGRGQKEEQNRTENGYEQEKQRYEWFMIINKKK
jgi:hypothetical protein